ncbi:hypothetical protein ACWCSD_52920 [Nonomuraea sp. NPDC001684]
MNDIEIPAEEFPEEAAEGMCEVGADEEEILVDAVPPAPPLPELPPEHAVSIDIYGKGPDVPPGERTQGHTINIPHKVVIDGQPVYLPRDSQVTVTAGAQEATAVTLTLFARRVRIGFEDELDGPAGVPPGQPVPAES